MQNVISNILGINSFVILNKAIVKALGMHEAVVLGFLIDKWAYFQHKDFYYTIQDLSNDTELSERECRYIIRKLLDKGILLKRAFEGLPPKQYYNINQDAIIDILKEPVPKKEKPTLENHTLENPTKGLTLAESNPFKNEILNPCRNDRDDNCKNASDILIYNNNKINNNKESNNKEKKEKYKKEKKKKTIFEEALELYPQDEKLCFSYDDWKEWVEYKVSIGKNLTILTFKKNLKQLIDFGDLAKVAMDTSISNNWVGLFPPHQKVAPNASKAVPNAINATNRNFKGGGLSARDKFANMDNPDYDPSVYDFSLLPSEKTKDAK